jgi:hypothetical protein
MIIHNDGKIEYQTKNSLHFLNFSELPLFDVVWQCFSSFSFCLPQRCVYRSAYIQYLSTLYNICLKSVNGL